MNSLARASRSSRCFRQMSRTTETNLVRPHSSQMTKQGERGGWGRGGVQGHTPVTLNRVWFTQAPQARKELGLYFNYRVKSSPSFSVARQYKSINCLFLSLMIISTYI